MGGLKRISNTSKVLWCLPMSLSVVTLLYPFSKCANVCSACVYTEFVHSFDSMQTSCCLAGCFSNAKTCFCTSIQSGRLENQRQEAWKLWWHGRKCNLEIQIEKLKNKTKHGIGEWHQHTFLYPILWAPFLLCVWAGEEVHWESRLQHKEAWYVHSAAFCDWLLILQCPFPSLLSLMLW